MWCALSQPVGGAVWNTTVTVFISVEYCGYSCMSRLYCSSYRSKNCWLKDLRQGRNHFPSKSVLTNQLAPFSFLNMFSGSTLGNHTFPTAAAKARNELQSTISLHHHCWHAANNSKLFSLIPYMTDLLMSVCELNWLWTRQMCHQQLIFFHLWYLCQIRQHISRQVMKQLLHAFVISRLDYCNGMLASLPMRLLGQLQRVQNAADRRVLGLQPRDHIKPALAASALEDTIQTVC